MSSDGIPTGKEVASQLKRLLASDAFAAQPARVLKFIVRRALHGKPVTEALLRKYTFDRKVIGKETDDRKYKHDSRIVGVTMNKVRRSLTKYYANEGKGDLVIIDARPRKASERTAGEAYRPFFRYNAQHKVAQIYERVEHLLGRAEPSQVAHGLKLLRETFAPGSVPDYSLLLMAEALVRLAGENWENTGHNSPLLAYIRELFSSLESLVPDAWRICIGCAAVDVCEGKIAEAGRRFDRALTLDRDRTLESPWYALFLLRAGRRQKMLQVAELYGEEITNASAYAMRGIILYRAGLLSDALTAFLYAIDLNRNCWAAHFGLTVWYHATRDYALAESHAQRVRELLRPDDLACLVTTLRLAAPADTRLIASAPLELPAPGDSST